MDFKKIFSGKGLSIITSMMMGGTPDSAKITALLSEMITDDNVKAVVLELHKKYAQEAAKLGAGHELRIELCPDKQRGLVLHFLDSFADDENIQHVHTIKTLYLAELTAADIQEFLKGAFGADDSTVLLDERIAAEQQRGENLKVLEAGVTAVENIIEATPKTESDV